MERIIGKRSEHMGTAELQAKLSGYQEIWLDIGTGDGRFVLQTARNRPDVFVLGVDASRENLRVTSQKAPGNALFIIANALALPVELHGLADRVTINFPWGSLLTGLLDAEPALLNGLMAVARPGAIFDVRLNGSALAEAGWELEPGGERVQHALISAGIKVKHPTRMDAGDLRGCPCTWAKRLAFGRAPYAVHIRGWQQAYRRAAQPGNIQREAIRIQP